MHYQFTDKDYLCDDFIFQALVSSEVEGHPFLDPETPPDPGQMAGFEHPDEVDSAEGGLDPVDA